MTIYWSCIVGMVIGFSAGVFFMGILAVSSEDSREEEQREFVERRKTEKEIARKLLGGTI